MGGYFLFVVVGSTSFLNPLNSRGLKSELYNISHNSKYPVIFYISYFRLIYEINLLNIFFFLGRDALQLFSRRILYLGSGFSIHSLKNLRVYSYQFSFVKDASNKNRIRRCYTHYLYILVQVYSKQQTLYSY